MTTNYEKRKSKDIESVKEEIVAKREQIRTDAEPTYPFSGYDIYTPNGGGTYLVAEIEFNPETKQARVKEIFEVSRLIALSYVAQKNGLRVLKKTKRG